MSADEWAEANRNPMLGEAKTTTEGTRPMEQYKTGDKIEHRLMPGFTMPVLDTRECETGPERPEPHLAYKVTDPEGNEDWLCAYDCQRPGEQLAWGA